MLIQADSRRLPLVDGCVDCVVTSPPYWGLRDYGMPAQLGLQQTPEAYVVAMVGVFDEVWRVLKEAGTLWLNIGDSYHNTKGQAHGVDPKQPAKRVQGLKPKDLVGIPWRLAFAMRAAGWYLRADVIWSKPNPMPESVTDRPTKAHEYVFLLSKSEKYFYDAHAIAEGRALVQGSTYSQPDKAARAGITRNGTGLTTLRHRTTEVRNRRTVWTIPTMPYAGAHFATMPEALVEPCILAGCPLGGLVLDPFVGSGTVVSVAERLGRRGVGVDLNPAYHQLAKVRTSQRGLRF